MKASKHTQETNLRFFPYLCVEDSGKNIPVLGGRNKLIALEMVDTEGLKRCHLSSKL